MLDTVNNFLAELDRIGWRYRDVRELEDGKGHVACGITAKSTQLDFHFFFDADNHSVSIRIFKLFIAPIDKKLQIMDLMNEVNAQYRWAKLFLDKESWMNVQADAVISAENSGKICVELIARTVRIMDETYPKFMHEIWA